jgi:hypothetical protein
MPAAITPPIAKRCEVKIELTPATTLPISDVEYLRKMKA